MRTTSVAEDSIKELILPQSFMGHAGFVVSDASFLKKPQNKKWKDRDLFFLNQVHGAYGDFVDELAFGDKGDWLATYKKNIVIGVFVADCTAVLVRGTNHKGSFVAAIHAGWRGTAEGIIEAAFSKLQPNKQGLCIWLSPGICQQHYEVSQEQIDSFKPDETPFFKSTRQGHALLDLRSLQCARLEKMGYKAVSSSLCTFEQEEFFSYRQMHSKLQARHFAWIHL